MFGIILVYVDATSNVTSEVNIDLERLILYNCCMILRETLEYISLEVYISKCFPRAKPAGNI